MPRFWNFIKSEANKGEIELRIDGEIIDDDLAWIYEWCGIPCASPNAFREELAQFAGKNVTVWINSFGGSVFAATGIYNALMAHKETGAVVTTIGDAKVMSAAMTLYMSGDKRLSTPGCIYMVHNPLTYASGYASDLRKVADVLDIVKESIMTALERSGLSRSKISALMDDETYMSAKTAISQGFVSEIIDWQGQNTQTGDIMNFSFPRMAIQNSATDSMRKMCDFIKNLDEKNNHDMSQRESIMGEAKKLLTAAWQSFSSHENNESAGEEQKLSIKNSDDLKKNYPDIANQITAEAIKNEQDRVAALDVLNDAANPVVQALVANAKATGKSAEDIKDVVEIAKKHAPAAAPSNVAAEHMDKVINDNAASGVNGVVAGAKEGNEDQKEIAGAINLMVNAMNNTLNGGKK